MKPKVFLALFLCLILGVGAVLPAAAQTSVSVTVSTNDPKTMAGLLIGGLMGAFFGAQSGSAAPAPAPSSSWSTVIVQRPQPADPWDDLPVWYVASWADVPVERIIELRRSGRRWVEIVERYRLPSEFRGHTVIITEPGHGRGRKKVKRVFVAYTDQEFERFVSIRFLEEYYAVPRATIVVWLDRGLSLHDIFLSVNLATRLRVRPDVIIRYRLAGEPWDYIARRYRVSVVDLSRPVIVERKARHRVRFDHWGGEQDDD